MISRRCKELMMIAAIDLGGTQTKFGIIEKGKIINAGQCRADAGGSIKAHLDDALFNLKGLCNDSNIHLSDCKGLGLLSTGVVDCINMRVLSTNKKYDDAVDFDFKKWASESAGLGIRMDNDARGALIGEWKYGAGKGYNNVVIMTLGTGVGTAVIYNGRPMIGPCFSAGGMGGHIIINSGGRRCTCGAVGCLEAEASGWALEEIVTGHTLYSESALSRIEKQNFKDLFYYAQAGDVLAKEIRDRFLTLWGEGVVTYIHLFDPEIVIIGGGLMNDPEPVLDSFRATVKRLAWIRDGQVKITAVNNPDNAGLIGAASLFED